MCVLYLFSENDDFMDLIDSGLISSHFVDEEFKDLFMSKLQDIMWNVWYDLETGQLDKGPETQCHTRL